VLATDYAEGRPPWAEAFTDDALGFRFWLRKA
jgi:hypothetical protein